MVNRKIVKLHGTSGSGKSTIVRNIMGMATEVSPQGVGKKPEAYKMTLPQLIHPLYVLGPYLTACGGMDAISDNNLHISLLEYYAKRGNVLYEGLLASGFYGRIGAASEKYGDDHIFAFLNTPTDVCLERIIARRLARGNTKALNPENTIAKVHAIGLLKTRLENVYNRPVVTIQWDKVPELQVLGLFS